MSGLRRNLEVRAKNMKRQIAAVYHASRDERVGFAPKIMIGIAILYVLSPIDLIPDFIPILGYLDDLILVPALLALAIRFIPADVMLDAQARAESEPLKLRSNWTFAIVFVALWLLAAFWLAGVVATAVDTIRTGSD